MSDIPSSVWRRRLDANEPSSAVHSFSRPPIIEALSLLPVAYRVGSYISNERSHGREPIFDLNGIALEPPNPGPHAGVPLGGLGGGSIGRGYKGEFRRWSLYPGRYVHRNVLSDVFAVRVKVGSVIYAKVLSVFPPDSSSTSCLSGWDWTLNPSCATYHALFPRSWTVYEDPVPGIRVTIKQVSPFLPHNYSESSLPVGVFEVEVENKNATQAIEVSVMLVFQNGYDSKEDSLGGLAHSPFQVWDDSSSTHTLGVCMAHHTVHHHRTRTSSRASSLSSSRGSLSADPITASPPMAATAAVEDDDVSVDQGSYAIAASIDASEGAATVSYCSQFTTSTVSTTLFSAMCASDAGSSSSGRAKTQSRSGVSGAAASSGHATPVSASAQATNLWNDFRDRGDLQDDSFQRISPSGCRVGAAVCIRQTIPAATAHSGATASSSSAGNKRVFRFALSWDHPLVRFKGALENPLRRYYTRFFGSTGLAAPSIAAYALLHSKRWESEIDQWQRDTLSRASGCSANNGGSGGDVTTTTTSNMTTDSTLTTAADDSPSEKASATPAATALSEGGSGDTYYNHQLFNELYFLVDGGTVWTDSSCGVSNPQGSTSVAAAAAGAVAGTVGEQTLPRFNESDRTPSGEAAAATARTKTGFWGRLTGSKTKPGSSSSSGGGDLSCDRPSLSPVPTFTSAGVSLLHLEAHLTTSLTPSQLQHCGSLMRDNNVSAAASAGDQSVVGQFLYLEGHEYLMYNTYDVHFYASFALLLLFPQLELSLQRDFARSVSLEDLTTRRMMGEGDVRPRKVKGFVPHDLGSPSESPWFSVNAYNFQDVSRWKDLGPKFVLQVYRDYLHVKQEVVASAATDAHSSVSSAETLTPIESFLSELFPIVLTVMQSTEAFDTDEDGMIENSGFPDQTYDIWTARGVHAYCGGLWIAACEATAAMARIVKHSVMASKYTELAKAARKVYVSELWNGKYLNYDSSDSDHHDSIMADMLAGQWYAHACQLTPVVTPQRALSCYMTIYDMNVVKFGEGRWMGAVNGMRPNGRVDSCCLQSREVWTGTTYALAAGMIHEALHSCDSSRCESDGDVPLSVEERARLVMMAENTARGIHDAGWREFGYWFATPEAWEKNGNYRSLGYMRPLSIWAIQFARESSQKGT